jgi:hypothetical protein
MSESTSSSGSSQTISGTTGSHHHVNQSNGSSNTTNASNGNAFEGTNVSIPPSSSSPRKIAVPVLIKDGKSHDNAMIQAANAAAAAASANSIAASYHHHHHPFGPTGNAMTSSLCNPWKLEGNSFAASLGQHHAPDPHHDFLMRTAVTHW